MATDAYVSGRSIFGKPQAIIWANNVDLPTSDSGFYLPQGTEFTDFIILPDHNRSDISIKEDRIENRKRMINGTMRSYHIATKEQYSWSWQRLPSKSFSTTTTFDSSGKSSTSPDSWYIVDAAASGWQIVKWYETHTGPFWMLMSYDKSNLESTSVNKYVKGKQVYFSSFDYSVEKRGVTDWWNISVSVEEL